MPHVVAEQVDHIIPFKSKEDPLRLDWRNCQSLCGTCHKRKTIRDTKAGLTRRYD